MRIEDALLNASKALAECTMQPTNYTPGLLRDLLSLEDEIARAIETAPEPLTAEMHHRIDYAIQELEELASALAKSARCQPRHQYALMASSVADGLRTRWGMSYFHRH